MNKNNLVRIAFTTAGQGDLAHFKSALGCGSSEVALGNLLREAHRAGAATLERQWYMEGYGSTKWVYSLDTEVLRDLMVEAGYTPDVAAKQWDDFMSR